MDAWRLETRDRKEALAEIRRWIRPRHLERESLDELLKWVRDEHETWTDVVSGENVMPAWLGSRGRRKIPEIDA